MNRSPFGCILKLEVAFRRVGVSTIPFFPKLGSKPELSPEVTAKRTGVIPRTAKIKAIFRTNITGIDATVASISDYGLCIYVVTRNVKIVLPLDSVSQFLIRGQSSF